MTDWQPRELAAIEKEHQRLHRKDRPKMAEPKMTLQQMAEDIERRGNETDAGEAYGNIEGLARAHLMAVAERCAEIADKYDALTGDEIRKEFKL